MPKGKRTKKTCKVSKCVKSYVHKALKVFPEKKYTAKNYNGLFCAQGQGATGAYYCITDNISQGDADANSRIGDQVILDNIDCRFVIGVQTGATSAANANPALRLIMFQYHETVDTTAATGIALDGILPLNNIFNVGAGNAFGPTQLYDVDGKRARTYTILYDKPFTLEKSVIGTYASGINQKEFRIKKKITRNNKLSYIGANSTTYAKNHIFVVCVSGATYDVTQNPVLYTASQVEYTDA